MALTNLDPKIVNILFLAKMVDYVHSGELSKDYEEAKKAEEKFGRMRAQQVFVTSAGMSACEDVAEKVTQIVEEHQEVLQKAEPVVEVKPKITATHETPTEINRRRAIQFAKTDCFCGWDVMTSKHLGGRDSPLHKNWHRLYSMQYGNQPRGMKR
ncbi:hypothetical protein LTR56_015986 [Elasticomyces elasticus]|nr:hypothetical protein LTR22_025213 [Elasticomyces elasticus]KAK3633072.1 hypothetical protein LTR56_015986 [Elasticomyces elasticus]KAK4917936.1 hypothetical protein LTR49_014211 [Elasticomyces elasticus]KAK5753332.1 hypothetical protein LTS12_016575 [Elasticomyces elasticus]